MLIFTDKTRQENYQDNCSSINKTLQTERTYKEPWSDGKSYAQNLHQTEGIFYGNAKNQPD